MNLKKRVIESTILAVMLTIVTAVTTVVSPVSVSEAASNKEAMKATDVGSDGVAGIIEQMTEDKDGTIQMAQVSIEKTNLNTVAEANEPELTEEQQAWSSKLMASVEDFLYIRSAADPNSDIIGKLYKGAAADITETLDGWYHITSGSLDGYVKSDYCVVGQDALTLANETCDTVAMVSTGGLRIRNEASEEAAIIKAASEGDKLIVDTTAPAVEGWVTVTVGRNTAYVSSEYVTVALNVGSAVSIEEERAALAKQAAEEEAKKAAQTTTAIVTQNAAVAANYDEVTILAAIIQCEAGYECYEGQVAVGAVVMNRVRSGSFPSSIYEVVYQSGQFTPAGSGKVAAVIAQGVSGTALQAAQEAISGVDNTGGALSFRPTSSGRSGLVIGNHVFF